MCVRGLVTDDLLWSDVGRCMAWTARPDVVLRLGGKSRLDVDLDLSKLVVLAAHGTNVQNRGE